MGSEATFSGPRPLNARVFLSYRREDSSGYCGRLYADLAGRFGNSNVFMDIDSLAPGSDFVNAIGHALASCDATLVLIGPHWLTATGKRGRRRIDDPADFVRL